MIRMFPGIHRSLLESLADQGYKGIYIEAYGIGGMPFLKHDFIGTVEKLMWILGMTENPTEIRDYYSINIAGEMRV